MRKARGTPPRLTGVLGAWLLGALLLTAHVAAEDKEEPSNVDLVALAAKMIGDGHYDRAEGLLSEVDEKAEGVDLKQLYTLRGVIFLKKQLFSAAADNFERAIFAGQAQPSVQLYLGQAYFGAKQYEKCLRALQAAGKEAETELGFTMKAQAQWELGQKAASIATLSQGLRRLPNNAQLERIKIFRLVELGLYQEVVELSRSYLARAEVSADDYVAIGQALRSGRQQKQAQLLLEEAHLKFPENEQVAIQLAHSYLDAAKPTVAALLFEDVARLQPKYYLEAAELYKKARRVERALRINARVLDQKAKLSQRLSLLLEKEQFEQVAAMAPSLSRLNLLVDDQVRYALAFAYYNTGQFERSERLLSGIQDQKLFEASLELRKAIENCQRSGWECAH